MDFEPLKFFISYNHADRTWAEWIAWQLEAVGHETVIRAWDFRPGANFVLEVQRASQEADRTIAVLSPSYLAAEFTQPEWAAEFRRDPRGENRRLLPVRVRECRAEGILGSVVYIDLVGLEDRDEARARLMEGLLVGRVRPEDEPAFPGAAATPFFARFLGR